MSTPNEGSEEQQSEASEVSVSYNTFKSFYSDNPELENPKYYSQFPTINQGTIRSWKSRAAKEFSDGSNTQQSTPGDQPSDNDASLMNMLISELITSTRTSPETLKGLDKKAQIRLLQNIKESQVTRSDPNIKMFTPTRSGKEQTLFDQFINIDEKGFREKGYGRVEIKIPASYAHDPEKNKLLTK